MTVAAGVGLAQTGHSYLEIKIPDNVPSENVFIRYVFSGDDLGGWVDARPGVPSYRISTNGRRGGTIRAVLYAPGCAIETLDLALRAAANPTHTFDCKPIGTVSLRGRLTRTDWMDGRDLRLQARYVARWAPSFLGLKLLVPMIVPLNGRVAADADGRFDMTLPDFAQDPQSGSSDHTGEVQIWAVDPLHGTEIAHLIPVGKSNSGNRTGSLRIEPAYPTEVVFDPCSIGRPPMGLIKRDGFVVRGDDRPESCQH